MTARARQALLWSGMFLLAFAGGRWLGSFAVSGVSSNDRPVADASETANFWDSQEAGRGDSAKDEPARRAIVAAPINHVCEGCDAGMTRDRQMAEQLGLTYADEDEVVDEDMSAGEEAAASPQPLASQPVARATIPPAPPMLTVSPTP